MCVRVSIVRPSTLFTDRWRARVPGAASHAGWWALGNNYYTVTGSEDGHAHNTYERSLFFAQWSLSMRSVCCTCEKGAAYLYAHPRCEAAQRRRRFVHEGI